MIATRPESKKLSYKLQRELDRLPAEISQLEKKLAMIHEQMADPGFYQSPAAEIAAVLSRAAVIQAELNAAFRRWEELEAQAAG